MAKLSLQIILLGFLFIISYVQGIAIKFRNITCDCRDSSFCSVQYCYIGHVNPETEYISARVMVLKPIYKDFHVRFNLMINRNGGKKLLYSIDIDVCRFMQSRYNAIAKIILGYLDNRTNINHTCPYTSEKFFTMDKVKNTEVAKRLTGLPVGIGYYALLSKWSLRNVTAVETTIDFGVLSS